MNEPHTRREEKRQGGSLSLIYMSLTHVYVHACADGGDRARGTIREHEKVA